MEITNMGKKKKKRSKSTIIDLAAFKKPGKSITLGDATLVIKTCFNMLRTQNSIRYQEVSF